MDSFEWNKVIGSVLVGLLIFMGVTILSDSIFHGEEDVLIGLDGEANATPTDVVISELQSNILALMVDADTVAGERSFRKCQACHTANDGGANKIGPNLYGVVGRPLATEAGFAYSGALTEKGGNWGYEDLDAFLTKPAKAIPGTKMSFPGIKTEGERANIIAYLRLQSASPMALPEADVGAEGDGE